MKDELVTKLDDSVHDLKLRSVIKTVNKLIGTMDEKERFLYTIGKLLLFVDWDEIISTEYIISALYGKGKEKQEYELADDYFGNEAAELLKGTKDIFYAEPIDEMLRQAVDFRDNWGSDHLDEKIRLRDWATR